MSNLNRVILTGNLTKDPELRHVANDRAVCKISLAVNRHFNDGNGQRQEEGTFVDADAWGRTAEVIDQYFEKGQPILIEGRLKLDQWQDESGANRSKMKVVVENFVFINPRPSGAGDAGGGPSGDSHRNESADRSQGRGSHRPQTAGAGR